MRWGPICVSWQTTLAACLMLMLIADTVGLQCYYCSGVTYYDPSTCFRPDPKTTLTHECRKDEKCEKKLVQLNYWQKKVERGCSSNCGDRKYIWTEDFQVHCCKDDGLCNTATGIRQSWYQTLAVTLVVFCVIYYKQQL